MGTVDFNNTITWTALAGQLVWTKMRETGGGFVNTGINSSLAYPTARHGAHLGYDGIDFVVFVGGVDGTCKFDPSSCQRVRDANSFNLPYLS
jgi:hypothetical protein